MRALALVERERFELAQVPELESAPGRVLLAPKYVGVCGTDVHVYMGEFEERIPYPAIMGHEFAGEIVEAPEEASGRLLPGTRAAFDPVLPCGRCPLCQAGKLNQCLRVRTFGLDTDGAMAELVSLPLERVYPLPDNVSLREAPMLELYTVALHAIGRAQLQPAENVVVLGSGRLGLSLIDLVSSSNPTLLVAIDVAPNRLRLATKLGATHALNAREANVVGKIKQLTDGLGADLVIEAVGDPEVIPEQPPPIYQAVQMLRPAGRVLVMGQGEREHKFPWRELVLKEGTVVTSRTSLGEMPRALKLMEQGVLRPNVIITHEFGVEDGPEVFAKLASGDKSMVKVVLNLSSWGKS